MKRSRVSKFVSAGSAIIVLLLLCEGVLGTLVVGAAGTGTTSIKDPVPPYTCKAEVGGSIPSQLDIDNGDDVIIYYNVSYSDRRPSGASLATHYFNMTVLYTKWLGDEYAEWEVETDGGDDSDSRSLSITVIGAEEGEMIGVIWIASIYCPTCSDLDEIGGGIVLT